MLKQNWSGRAAVALVTVAAVCGLGLAGAGSASADSLARYPGSVPGWATPANDQGAAAADQTQEGEIYLPLRNQAGAERVAQQISTPGSAQYRKTLTPDQWIARFAPTQATLDQVLSYLTSKGLTITTYPKSRLFVAFRGTATQVGSAFATSIHRYSHAGRTVLAPTAAPAVPAALGGSVTAISIDQARLLSHPNSVTQDADAAPTSTLRRNAAVAPAAPVITTPCSHYFGENVVTTPSAYNGNTRYSTYNCGYTPAQLRSAYGVQSLVSGGNDGTGQTIAITDAYASPSIVQDVNTYSRALGEPVLKKGQYTQIVPTPAQFQDQELCQQPSGWQGEQTLDVESVHAIAPGANILYVGGYNCGGGLDAALSTIVDGRLATMISNSWGDIGEDLPYDVLTGESHVFLQAAAEGIGMYFSSGDNGDEVANTSTGTAQPDFPASSPWVTSVGGTAIGIDKSGKLAFETGWGDQFDQIVKNANGKLKFAETLPGTRFVGGAGGGVSTLFAQPAYQKGIVPSSLAQGKRVSPDVASLADPYTGFLIGIRPITDDVKLTVGAFENETYGGTSLASPLTAAQVALVQQRTGTTLGFANPTLYGLQRSLPSLFRDVLPQNPTQALVYTSQISGNTYFVSLDQDTSLKTTAGYDEVTGLGNISFTLLSYAAQQK